MKKLILVSSIALTLNACKFIHMKEPYLEAENGKKLEIEEGLSSPNQVSTLDVPQASSDERVTVSPSDVPPKMPIRTRQSDDGRIVIKNRKGFPVLTLQASKDLVLEKMKSIDLEDWSYKSANEQDCVVTLYYNDSAARERENAGFFKKLFTRDSFYSDYSGDYNLTCSSESRGVEITFAQADGDAAMTFLADSVMNSLFESLSQSE